MGDIAAGIREILFLHLGCDRAQLTDDARLAADLGADSLDIVEVMMSCEERFDIDIPTDVAASLRTVGDAVAYVTARVAGAEPDQLPMPALPDVGWGQSFLRYFSFRKLAGI
ncbi:MAG: acyl carrier protein [Solimonas sp.]